MTSSRPTRSLLSRLYKDLVELQDNPYPGVAVFTDDANLRNLCLVLTPPSGPWKDLALHFDVELPDSWPAIPPKVQSSVRGIEHPNLFGSFICCDLLRPLESLQRRYTGGYTPAFTLRGLFLQFLTFFSSTKVEQDYGYSVEIGDLTCVCYVWERDIHRHLPPGECRCRGKFLCSDEKEQLSLAGVWRDCTAQEVIVPTTVAGTKHKSKYVLGRNFEVLHKLEYPNPRREKTLQMITGWACKTCPYGSPSLPHHSAAISINSNFSVDSSSLFLKPAPTCLIETLNDDTLGEVASHLTSEGIIAFSIAYPRFREIAALLHVLRRQELVCFFLRTPLSHSILGIGVALDAGARSLFSDFDWLSMEAFDVHGVRKSVEKRPFSFFLPLAFNRLHFAKAEQEIWKRLSLIEAAVRNAERNVAKKSGRPANRRLDPPLKPHHTVEVIYRMMNNIVVSLMKSCDDTMQSNTHQRTRSPGLLLASEKAIVSYCHLFHLLIRLSEKTPAILHDATWTVRMFIQQQQRRLKLHTPDMGEFIVIVMLVLVLPPIDDKEAMSWDALVGKFLAEAVTRNVRWVLKDVPELEVLETGSSDYRLDKTLASSKTSLRLMMFQVTFLNLFIQTYSSNISKLDDNYGFVDEELPEKMVGEIKAIYQIDAWPQFFQKVKFAKGAGFSKATFSQMLRDCVKMSAERKYHSSADYARMQQLIGRRNASEKINIK